MPDSGGTKPKNQRTVHVDGDAEDNVIIAGDNVTVNIHQAQPSPKIPDTVLKKKFSVSYKVLLPSAIVIFAALSAGIYLKMPKTLNISGKWTYHAHKDERTWTMTQKGRDININEDSGNECTGKLDKNNFSFSCSEQMTGGAESEKFTGTGQLNQESSKIQGKWERQGLDGNFVLEKN